VSIEVLIPSAEDAAAGYGELWLDGRLLATTRMTDDHWLALEISQGPWELGLAEFHRALDQLEEAIAGERPAAG
jgi:hypothetical protein